MFNPPLQLKESSTDLSFRSRRGRSPCLLSSSRRGHTHTSSRGRGHAPTFTGNYFLIPSAPSLVASSGGGYTYAFLPEGVVLTPPESTVTCRATSFNCSTSWSGHAHTPTPFLSPFSFQPTRTYLYELRDKTCVCLEMSNPPLHDIPSRNVHLVWSSLITPAAALRSLPHHPLC